MHAYLIVGGTTSTRREAELLARRLKTDFLEFPLSKIEDVRSLGAFVSLLLEKPTAIYVRGIDGATPEAMNAFLKNLEEPQEGLYFILTAQSLNGVLPTIVSRCQILISTKDHEGEDVAAVAAKKFLEVGIGEKLAFISEIKERPEASAFITKLILGCHALMLKAEGRHSIYSTAIREAISCKKALEANGNVTIQLTNFVSSLV